MERVIKFAALGSAIFFFAFPLQSFAEDADTSLKTEPEYSNFTSPAAADADKVKAPDSPFYTYNPRAGFHLDLGLMLGMMNADRTGTLTGTTIDGALHSSVGGGLPEAGALLKILVGPDSSSQFFFYFNLLAELNNSSTVFSRTVGTLGEKATVVLQGNWMERVGLGWQTKAYTTHKIRFGAGLGAAVIPQRLIASIDDVEINQQKDTNIVPSLMATVGVNLCDSCFAGLPMTLSAQLVADRNAKISMTNVTPLGNSYEVSVNQQWQFHEYAVFAVHL